MQLLQVILGAIEAIIRVLTHWAFKNLFFFPLHHFANDVAKSGSDSRTGIDEINHFRDVWLSRDLHWPPLKDDWIGLLNAAFGCFCYILCAALPKRVISPFNGTADMPVLRAL
jgi:hypothetical protein